MCSLFGYFAQAHWQQQRQLCPCQLVRLWPGNSSSGSITNSFLVAPVSLKGLVFSPFNILSCEMFNNNNFSKMFEAVPFPAAGDCSLRSGYYGGGTTGYSSREQLYLRGEWKSALSCLLFPYSMQGGSNILVCSYMTHSQMLGKIEYTLPPKFWRLVGCTEMLSW